MGIRRFLTGAFAIVAFAGPAVGDDPPRDARGIRAAIEAFLRSYNAGDAKDLASQFTEKAEVIDVDGTRFEGRDQIEELFKSTFEASPGVRMSVHVDSIRFLGPDAAREEGRSTITPAGGEPPVCRRYTVLYVREGDRWLQDSVREAPELRLRPHDHLKPLEWLIGDWIDEGEDSVVRVNCRWSDDENFLLRTFQVVVRGKPAMTVSQRIGWDPKARQIKSWEFDSEGGYGEGLWSRDGDRWMIKHSGVTPDGESATATHLMMKEGPDRIRWAAVDRVVGGEILPDEQAYLMVRSAGRRVERAVNSTPNPTPTRNPR